MQDKQKVTLYLSQDLHRRLKIRAAVDLEPMSDLAERAIRFYLAHPGVVDAHSTHGNTHQVYDCPECANTLVLRDNALMSLRNQPNVLSEQSSISVENVRVRTNPNQPGEEELVPC